MSAFYRNRAPQLQLSLYLWIFGRVIEFLSFRDGGIYGFIGHCNKFTICFFCPCNTTVYVYRRAPIDNTTRGLLAPIVVTLDEMRVGGVLSMLRGRG